MNTSLLKTTVSALTLMMALNASGTIASYSDEETPKGRHSVGEKDWEIKSIDSRAFSERPGPAPKKPSMKEELSYEEEDLEDSASQRSGFGAVEVRGQKLTEIKELKKYIFKGNLEITPTTYEALSKFSTFYETAFKTYDRGLFIKGWKTSLGFEPLVDLLHTFEKVRTFKISINWDKEDDASETLIRAIQFYEDLVELDISNCKLTETGIVDIIDSIANPEKLKILDITGNKLSPQILQRIKKLFPNLVTLKSDINLTENQEVESIPLTSLTMEERTLVSGRAEEEKRPAEMRLTIPPVARGYEEIYQRFLKGVLIYRPQEGSDVGMIKLPIAALSNPLEGTFDLSQCGDAGKYLSISTGYRKGKKAENANKVEIWFAPRFLIEKELKTTARHFQAIYSTWREMKAPVGIFWTWGAWDDLSWYDYLTTENFDQLSNDNLFKKGLRSKRRIVLPLWRHIGLAHIPSPTRHADPTHTLFIKNFMFILVN